MAEPKCPSCSIEGLEHVVSSESAERAKQGNPWFYIAYCEDCGHVYGVFAKHVFGTKAGPQLVLPERKR